MLIISYCIRLIFEFIFWCVFVTKLVIVHPEKLRQQCSWVLHQVHVITRQQFLQKFCFFVLDLKSWKFWKPRLIIVGKRKIERTSNFPLSSQLVIHAAMLCTHRFDDEFVVVCEEKHATWGTRVAQLPKRIITHRHLKKAKSRLKTYYY